MRVRLTFEEWQRGVRTRCVSFDAEVECRGHEDDVRTCLAGSTPTCRVVEIPVPPAPERTCDDPEDCPVCGSGYFTGRCRGCGFTCAPREGGR